MEDTQKSPKYTLEQIKNSCTILYGNQGELLEICEVSQELENGIKVVSKYDRIVTMYGSARLSIDHPVSMAAKDIASRLVKEAGYAVMTGGAGGVMAASNKGAREAGGVSIGSTIKLYHEQITNPDLTEMIPFEYFFTRKTVLRYGSECAIFFTGGFGTFDELFELLTLIQTNKIKKIPVILFGSEFWKPLDAYIKKILIEENKTIGPTDVEIYTITDSIDEVIRLAKHAPTKLDSGIND